MGTNKLCVYDMYWAAETRYAKAADIMPNKRYKELPKYIYAADSTKKKNHENENDKLFQIHPILEGIRANCINVELEEVQLIDEQIIPAKTKSSGVRQCNPQIPKNGDSKCA